MFRPLRRKKQEIGSDRCREILRAGKRGVLSLVGDDGYPYGVPIDYVYDEEDNALLFHCAKEGHKIDAIRRCDKASFCTATRRQESGEWFFRYESVIVFGRMTIVEGEEMKRKICDALCDAFGQGQSYKDDEWIKFGKNVQAMRLAIEHVSGKSVKEE